MISVSAYFLPSVPALTKLAMGTNGLLSWMKTVPHYLSSPPHPVASRASSDTPGILWAPLRQESALALCHPGALRRRDVECTVRKKKWGAGTRSDRQDNGTGPKDTLKSKIKNIRGVFADRSKTPMAP